MSKFPPKPQTGHIWQGELTGMQLYEEPSFFEAGRMVGKLGSKGSYFVTNDVMRWTTDYALDLKERRWVPLKVLSFARGVKEPCAECVNDPARCICIHRYWEFSRRGFKPFPEQLEFMLKEVA